MTRNWCHSAEVMVFFLVAFAVFAWIVAPSKEQHLLKAVADGNTSLVTELSHKGADVNFATKAERTTPLMLAAARGNETMVLLLLNLGARYDAQDASGRTAQDYASDSGWTNLTSLLSSSRVHPKRP